MWILVVLVALVAQLWLAPRSWDLRVGSDGVAVTAGTEGTQVGWSVGWDGQWAVSCSLQRPEPPSPPSVVIRFTTDGLEGVLVRPGQVIRVGDLIGIRSVGPAGAQRLAELKARAAQVTDDFLRAELQEEIARLSRELEVRALVAGRVLSVEVEQRETELDVIVRVQYEGG